MTESLGRPVSPDTTRNLWSAVKNLQESGQGATVDKILERIGHLYEWSLDQVQEKTLGAATAGLLTHSLDADKNTIYALPTVPRDAEEPIVDWYCMECHESGDVVGCATCYRVYHPACLNLADLEGAEFSCPICVSCEKDAVLDHNVLRTQLESILMWILDKGGSSLGEPQLGSKLPHDLYQLLIARDIDLAAMRTKLNTQRYPTPRHFLADFQLLVHNVSILYGRNAPLTKTANDDLLNQVRIQIDGMEEQEQIIEPGDNVMDPIDAVVHSGRKRGHPTPQGVGVKRPRGMTEEVWGLDPRFKKLLMDLQRHWLIEYQHSREKLLIDLTEKLHTEFLADQQKVRTELLTQFKDELDATRQELEQKYKETLRGELMKLNEKNDKEIGSIKKKQWCWQCESEAIYHCCWNTAYCSVECQQAHWPTHRKYCRRKKGQPMNQ